MNTLYWYLNTIIWITNWIDVVITISVTYVRLSGNILSAIFMGVVSLRSIRAHKMCSLTYQAFLDNEISYWKESTSWCPAGTLWSLWDGNCVIDDVFFCIFLNPLNVICNDRFSYELHILLRRSPELVQQTKHIPVLYVPVFSKLKSSDVLIIH